ncbi:hypothetical protein MB02_07820 [Croceicoccus estronivorus]|nr:hypothetical protein MB02_07820 [Croceicoccus estronivorus]
MHQTYTPSTGYQSGGVNTPAILAVIAIHIAVISVLLGMGVIAVKPPPPERLAVFDVHPASPPPPPPAPVDPSVPKKQLPTQTTAPRAPIQLSTVATAAPAEVSLPPAVAVEAPPAPPAPPAPVTPPDFSAAQLKNPGPQYPYLSRRQREEGVVLLKVLVTPQGNAGDIKVEQSSGFDRLDQAALKTVRRWHFLPAKQAGRAVAAWVLVPVSFFLS